MINCSKFLEILKFNDYLYYKENNRSIQVSLKPVLLHKCFAYCGINYFTFYLKKSEASMSLITCLLLKIFQVKAYIVHSSYYSYYTRASCLDGL